jgi:transposase
MNLIEQVGKAQVKNILAKLKAGKTITQREQKIVASFEESGDAHVLTEREVAEIGGVSQPTARGWLKQGAPRTREKLLTWLAQKREEEPTNQGAAKLKKTLMEVELLDLKIQQQKGELVSRSAMREAGQRVGALIVAELAAMANDAPGQLAGADEATIRERLEARHVVLVNRLRTAIAEIETVGIDQ